MVTTGWGAYYDGNVVQSVPLRIYTSTDSGGTWTETSSPITLWASVASSADGVKLVAASVGSDVDMTFGFPRGVGFIYSSVDSGLTWTQSSAPALGWQKVISSADGVKLFAQGGQNRLFSSKDSGTTWFQTTIPPGIVDLQLAMSADGTRLMAADGGSGDGKIYVSTDAGATWLQTSAPSNYWRAAACSADGMKLAAASIIVPGYGGDGLIYVSTNAGATWNPSSMPPQSWSFLEISADGSVLVADMDDPYSGSTFYTSQDLGLTWNNGANLDWDVVAAVALSPDGSKLVAATLDLGIYTSYRTSYSGPWKQIGTPTNCISIAVSAHGNVVLATDGRHFSTSTNLGSSWLVSSASAQGTITVASSQDSTRLFATVSGGPIYISTNAGAGWTPTSAPVSNWVAVACSADGNRVVAITASGGIYSSRNAGADWLVSNTPRDSCLSIACSADGSKMFAATFYGDIYTSTNAGITWATPDGVVDIAYVACSADGTELVGAYDRIFTSADSSLDSVQTTAPEGRWLATACSADGTKLFALQDVIGTTATGVSISINSGMTWTEHGAFDGEFQTLACSTDGNTIVGVTFDNRVYSMQLPFSAPTVASPRPHVDIRSSGGGTCLSWVVPSTSFVLQQSSDLDATDWTEVMTIPTLNSTNLHYEVTVPPYLRNAFFRLKQQ